MSSSPLRRNRDFRALWIGQTASGLGTSISSLAYPLLVLANTGSAALAGLVGTVLAMTTFVFRIPASVVTDRVDRKRLMLVCDAGRFLAVGSLAIAVLFGHANIGLILAVAVCEGVLGVLFGPAETIAVRRIVDADQVRHAIAVNQSRQSLAGLLGPSVSGTLFGISRSLPFAADALSYLISFVSVATLRTSLPASAHGRTKKLLWKELIGGLTWLWADRFLRSACLWLAGAGLLFTSLGLVTIVLATELHSSPAQIGVAFTITGAGGLVGALLAPLIVRRYPSRTILIGYAWVSTTATTLLFIAPSVWVIGAIGAVAFLLVPAVNATIMAQVVSDAPEEVQGRAIGAANQLTTVFHPLGPALVGVLIEWLGTGQTIIWYAAAFLALALIATLTPLLRANAVLPAADST